MLKNCKITIFLNFNVMLYLHTTIDQIS